MPKGRLTKLIISPQKVKEAMTFAETVTTYFASLTPAAKTVLCGQLGLEDFQIYYYPSTAPTELRFKVWANNPRQIKDSLLRFAGQSSSYWGTFLMDLESVVPTGLAERPCILI